MHLSLHACQKRNGQDSLVGCLRTITFKKAEQGVYHMLEELIELLWEHCEEKPKAEIDDDDDNQTVGFHLEDDSSEVFAKLYFGDGTPVLLLRGVDVECECLAKMHDSIVPSERKSRTKGGKSGWNWVDVVLDGSISEKDLVRLIDHSYEILYYSKFPVEEVEEKPMEDFSREKQKSELERLIAYYKLSHLETDIQGIAQQAVLLKTRRAKGTELELGQTKIGGLPDLPESLQWPSHHSGKHLAFLAQINLAEVSQVISLENLPGSGILYFFSVYGWQVEGDSDPQLPEASSEEGWTQVLYQSEMNVPLRRRKLPSDVNGFKPTAVEFIPVLSLPDGKEPVVTALKWKEDDLEHYDWDLVLSYRKVRNKPLRKASPHLLLGYAEYEQECPKVVAENNLQLLFQLATDFKADMCWGDGGLIYFWMKPEDIVRRDFSTIFVDYQCG